MTPWTRAARLALAVTCFGSAPVATPARANELKQDTLRAWQSYVRSAEAKTENPVNWRPLSMDAEGTSGQVVQVRSGQPVITGAGPYKVPHGLIHDWTGTIFVPNVTITSVAQVLAEYDQYQDFYRPLVASSSLTGRGTASDLVTLTMVEKAFSVTAAVRTEDEVRTTTIDAGRAYSISKSIRVQEISNYGRRGEQLFQEGRGPGYVWETFTVTRLEQRDGGVFVEMEMLELSRGIPFEFSWLIGPLTERLPRTIMNTMLLDTKAAIEREILLSSKAASNAPQTAVPARTDNVSVPMAPHRENKISCRLTNQPASNAPCQQSQPMP